MTTGQNSRDLFQSVEKLLNVWLEERAKLLACYTELATAFEAGTVSQIALQSKLCERLVDYVSTGHFEVFIKLVEEAESFSDGSETVAKRLIPDIADTTEFILAYEEKYTDAEAGTVQLPRGRDISALGEMLETRFALEDQLVVRLHNKHRRLTAPV